MSRLIIFSVSILPFFVSCSDITTQTNDNLQMVELPDGSNVYLNKHTKLIYTKDFISDRSVELKGEAYFDVTENSSPFKINTAEGSILITGTKLNVNTSDEALVVEVDQGSVEVTTQKVKKVLKRGQRATCKFLEEDIKVDKAERKFAAWMKQLDKSFDKIKRQPKKFVKKGAKSLKKGLDKAEKKLDN